MIWNISGYSLKRLILKRMRAAGLGKAKIHRAARVRFPLIPHERILGESLKTNKNRARGMLTAIMYLAPERLSVPYGGRNLCPWATTCKGPCLAIKGRLGPASDGENAELWRTLTYVWARAEFSAILRYALNRHARRARDLDLDCGVRLNGGSDVLFEKTLPEVFRIPIQYYDYTKSVDRMFRARPANYDLTFSFDGFNLIDCKRVLRARMNVAIVSKDPTRMLARKRYHGFKLINGDTDDCRPYDPKPRWVVLSVKGHAKDDSGFFVS